MLVRDLLKSLSRFIEIRRMVRTVFASARPDGSWTVRYFSPETEVPFCGHATIALGAVLGQTH
jgi:predicted PhzF superfamily epimerase YddE/YHI9